MRGMGNMQGMMKQMQKLQKQMAADQEVLNSREFVGEASSGMVKVTITGNRQVKNVNIAKEAVDPDDVEMLEDLVLMAINQALAIVEKETAATMGKYAKGIPGL